MVILFAETSSTVRFWGLLGTVKKGKQKLGISTKSRKLNLHLLLGHVRLYTFWLRTAKLCKQEQGYFIFIMDKNI